MKRSKLFLTAIAVFALLLSGCGTASQYIPSCCVISIPTPQLTGAKTSIERQIVGEYRELEDDAWAVSSVKTNVQKGEGTSRAPENDTALFKGMKIRQSHIKIIRKYKDEGALGEKNNGFVEYRKNQKYERNSKRKKRLFQLIKEENRVRRIIFERSLIRTGVKKPLSDDIDAFGRIFAEEQAALAKKNDWVQNKSGVWVRKK